MIVLGIETSTAVCSVGLASDSGLSAEQSIVESHIHSEKLLTLIRALCDKEKVKLSQLDGIAISIGPGSFTGLRIGLSSAKGLCYAVGKPLIAISTFEAIAIRVHQMHSEFLKIIICVDAKQGEYYIGVYENKGESLNVAIPVHIGTLDSAVASMDISTAIFVTDLTDDRRKCTIKPGLLRNILPYCRGDVIALLGCNKLKTGVLSDIKSMEPMYLKDFIVRMRLKSESQRVAG